jgi:hypothetical protein
MRGHRDAWRSPLFAGMTVRKAMIRRAGFPFAPRTAALRRIYPSNLWLHGFAYFFRPSEVSEFAQKTFVFNEPLSIPKTNPQLLTGILIRRQDLNLQSFRWSK